MHWKWGCLMMMVLTICGCRIPSWIPWIGHEAAPVPAYAVPDVLEADSPETLVEMTDSPEEDWVEAEVVEVLLEAESIDEEKPVSDEVISGTTLEQPVEDALPVEEAAPLPAPRRVKMPVPVLPAVDQFEAFAGGWVDVLVKVDASGHVLEVNAVDASHADLVEATLRALAQARYEIEVREDASPEGLPALIYFDRVDY